MAKRKPTTSQFTYKGSSSYRAPPGERARAISAYTQHVGKAPPKSWNTAKIKGRTATLKAFAQPLPKPVVAAPAKAVATAARPIAAATQVATAAAPQVAAKTPGVLARAAASPAAKVAGRVALGAARGFAVGVGVQAGLQAAVGAYRDGWRGAGRGVVDAVTFGLGNEAYDRKFGKRSVPIDQELKEDVTDTAISVASMVAAGTAGAKLGGIWGVGGGMLIGGGIVAVKALNSWATHDMLKFKPETDKDRADTRKAHRKIEAMTSGTRYSERLQEKSESHRNHALAGAAVKYIGYGTSFAGAMPPLSPVAIGAGVAMAGAGAAYEGHHDRKAKGLRRRAVAIDYMARRSRLDNTSGTTMAVGQNASLAFQKANAQFSARQRDPLAMPTPKSQDRAGEFYDRTRRDPRSGKTIHEKVRNPHYR